MESTVEVGSLTFDDVVESVKSFDKKFLDEYKKYFPKFINENTIDEETNSIIKQIEIPSGYGLKVSVHIQLKSDQWYMNGVLVTTEHMFRLHTVFHFLFKRVQLATVLVLGLLQQQDPKLTIQYDGIDTINAYNNDQKIRIQVRQNRLINSKVVIGSFNRHSTKSHEYNPSDTVQSFSSLETLRNFLNGIDGMDLGKQAVHLWHAIERIATLMETQLNASR